MSVTILNKEYDINLELLYLQANQLSSLPAEIGNLINLQILDLSNNELRSLPAEIRNLININYFIIDETSYEINNLDNECKILIFGELNIKIMNLPINLKEIWLRKNIKKYDIKLPLNCEIRYF